MFGEAEAQGNFPSQCSLIVVFMWHGRKFGVVMLVVGT